MPYTAPLIPSRNCSRGQVTERSLVHELFYITNVANVESILGRGILSHNGVGRLRHERVDLEVVQERRAHTPVGDRMLHDFANLYVCGRNPMMFYIKSNNPIEDVCLLRVTPTVLDLVGVVVMDGNAASAGTRADAPDPGLARISFDRIHAEFWTHPDDPVEYYRHKREKWAEVLVPDLVDPAYIIGAYAPMTATADRIRPILGDLDLRVASYPFFL